MKILCERVERIDILASEDKYEEETSYRRRLAYDQLEVQMTRRA
jgi:hypothetical protein